jgi:formate/nitrite transporter FocA (FNT family)
MFASIVDTGDLLELLWTAALAGVAVTAIFAVAIVGATRAVDMSRGGRPVGAAVFGLVGALALAGVGAAIAFGIVVMTQK